MIKNQQQQQQQNKHQKQNKKTYLNEKRNDGHN